MRSGLKYFSRSMMLFVLRLISRLPYRGLHAIAGLLAWVAEHGVQYRLPVIRENLKRSFPLASPEELARLQSGFYRHFADITMESIKHFSISNEDAMQRMRHENTELFDRFFAEGRSVLIAGGHLNNWELYAMSANQSLPHDVMAVYKRLSDLKMDQAVRDSRQRFGLEMVRTVDAQTWMEQHVRGERPKAVVMGFDQSPADPRKCWWTTFLNQETAWYYGLEKWARSFDMPVIYGHIYKDRRGWYHTRYELVVANPVQEPEGAILEKCMALLESDIHQHPTEWLWSHKRWKHARPADMPLNPRRVGAAVIPHDHE